jgi:hypothetical protein
MQLSTSIYQVLAGLDHRAGQADRARALSKRRLELWQQWDRKLADNRCIVGQLETARAAMARDPSPLPSEHGRARPK